MLIVERTYYAKVAANAANRLRKRIDTHATPHGGPWLEVPMHASRNNQIIFEFFVERAQLNICREQLLAPLN
jgi:hypothetical protein